MGRACESRRGVPGGQHAEPAAGVMPRLPSCATAPNHLLIPTLPHPHAHPHCPAHPLISTAPPHPAPQIHVQAVKSGGKFLETLFKASTQSPQLLRLEQRHAVPWPVPVLPAAPLFPAQCPPCHNYDHPVHRRRCPSGRRCTAASRASSWPWCARWARCAACCGRRIAWRGARAQTRAGRWACRCGWASNKLAHLCAIPTPCPQVKDVQKGTRVVQTLCSEGKASKQLPLTAKVRMLLVGGVRDGLRVGMWVNVAEQAAAFKGV